MPELNADELAQSYGFTAAVLNSDPDLKRLFERAVAETWTPDRFVAQVRGTKWYQDHAEQWRNAAILKASDPKTYEANVAQVQTRIGMMASELGATLGKSLPSFAEQAYQLGWDDKQIRANLSTYVQYTDGRLLGQAGQYETELRDWSLDNGLTHSDSWYRNAVANVIGGKSTLDDWKRKLTESAASAYPHLADRLRSGETVASVAEPYRQTMAQLLELNPDAVNLTDPTIKKALAVKDNKGNQSLQPLWEFENTVRSDGRWLKTKNAQDEAMNVTRRVLTDMGLVS